VAGLHQLTVASASKITDTYEPKEEGLDVVTVDRTVPVINITLSKEALDTSHPGYQAPLTAEEMLELGDAELESRPAQRGRGRWVGGGGCLTIAVCMASFYGWGVWGQSWRAGQRGQVRRQADAASVVGA
jgi:hypothetical protein